MVFQTVAGGVPSRIRSRVDFVRQAPIRTRVHSSHDTILRVPHSLRFSFLQRVREVTFASGGLAVDHAKRGLPRLP